MKVAIITTVNHNVGDDFVREGLKYILRQYYSNEPISFSYIHKHSPITSRYGFEWFRNLQLSKRVDALLPLWLTKDRILEADLVIQSGAPVYWCHDSDNSHCFQNEWYEPLIKRRLERNKGAKLVNLAAGSCQRFDADGKGFCDNCNAYIKEFYDKSEITTLRDQLSKVILGNIGLDAPVIPCSSIFAKDEYNLQNEGEEYVVVNYMKGGAHYTFGQKIDFKKWQREFRKFYFELKEKEQVIFSCHNQKEVDEAKEIDPKANIFFEKDDFEAYLRFYSKAKYGIMNRVHGAFILGSFGKPSVLIGNDSRAKMFSEIGLESIFVNDADYDLLTQKLQYIQTGAERFADRFQQIKKQAFDDYMKALSTL